MTIYTNSHNQSWYDFTAPSESFDEIIEFYHEGLQASGKTVFSKIPSKEYFHQTRYFLRQNCKKNWISFFGKFFFPKNVIFNSFLFSTFFEFSFEMAVYLQTIKKFWMFMNIHISSNKSLGSFSTWLSILLFLN